MAYCSRYQVKYSLYRTCEWYKAVVKSVTDTIVEVTFTGDGSSASLQSDVLCNTKRFRYLSRPRDGSALAMSRRAGSKANSSKDRLNYNGYLLSYYTHYLVVGCVCGSEVLSSDQAENELS